MNGPQSNIPRVAVAGCGSQMMNNLLPALQFQDVAIVAACDIDPGRRDGLARMFRIERTYPAIEELLAEESIDGICIAAGAAQHPQLVAAALQRGVPVFVEKPPAPSAAEARALMDLSAQTRTPIMVGFNKRFAPAYRALLDIGRREREQRPLALTISATCGGYAADHDVLLDFGIHYLDLARFLLGRINRVYAIRAGTSAGACSYSIALNATGGEIGQIFITSLDTWANPSENVFAQWRHSAVEVSNLATLIHRRQTRDLLNGWDNDFQAGANQLWQPNFSAPSVIHHSAFIKGFLGEMAQFATMLRLRMPPRPAINDAMAALQLIEAIETSLETHEPVSVPQS